MFPWHWTFLWAPRWPASGNVTLSGWTNSLFTVREAVAVTRLQEFATLALRQDGQTKRLFDSLSAGESSPEYGSLKADVAVVESLLERLKVRP